MRLLGMNYQSGDLNKSSMKPKGYYFLVAFFVRVINLIRNVKYSLLKNINVMRK